MPVRADIERQMVIVDDSTKTFAHAIRTKPGRSWPYRLPQAPHYSILTHYSDSFDKAALARKGVSIYKIAKLLGNSFVICERHYAHLCPAGLAEEVEFGHATSPVAAGYA